MSGTEEHNQVHWRLPSFTQIGMRARNSVKVDKFDVFAQQRGRDASINMKFRR